MHERILMAGAGGQGLILLGKTLASIAIDTFEHVTFFPAYGAEVRGGTSNCQIILSSDPIASPLSEQFDSMIIMNQPSMDRFFDRLTGEGLAVINTSLCSNPGGDNVVPIDAIAIADSIGNTRCANFVMLGALLARKKLVSIDNAMNAVREVFSGAKARFAEHNIKALNAGIDAAGCV